MKKIRTIEKGPVTELKRLRVCAYVRVSTDQVEQKESFSAQVQHYTSYINGNPAWTLAGIYADEALNTLNAESELMLTILSSVAEEELVSISQNMRWAYQRRFKQGKVTINTTRFLGYNKDQTGNLIINEEQADIVRRIFADYLSGMGISKIAKRLTTDGIINISGNTKWSSSVIREIIKNEKYIGDSLLQKTVTKDFKKKRNKGEVPMYDVKDSHSAIINRKDFEKAQELMAERAQSRGNVEGEREKYLKRYPLTGTIECGHCGKTYKRHLDNCGTVAE